MEETQQLPQEKFAEELDRLDEGLSNLQVLYEKYFLGIDRRPPDQERKRVSTRLREMRSESVRNTALKFRVQSMFAKLISFERMWDRTLREMEEGTYKRDVFKAKLRSSQRRDEVEPAEPAAPAQPQISEGALRKVFETYLVARQRTGESTEGLTFESVAARIRQQVPQLLEKHKARNVEFKVVIQGGKAKLKVTPR